jgi:cellulose synthase/poly-beta-1,6-N-acetylglucosamine synthase-like glycosyltransferase
MIIAIIFWISVLLVFHTYLFYPFILRILSLNKKNNELIFSEDELPGVSVIISAFNEEDVIGEKLNTVLRSDYPQDKYEIIIGSDASTDKTAEIVSSFASEYDHVRFFDFKDRRGKGNVVNDLVGNARFPILVLTDANVMFDPGTLKNLVRHFKNDKIGLVDTNMINKGLKKEGISYQEKAYISREVNIKNLEGRLWGAMMGPFGGCYAIRKEDYSHVPSNYLVDDFFINMRIFEKGKYAINDLDARVFEDVSNNLKDEFRRKVRIATGNMQNLKTFYRLLFRKRIGFCFFSHKVLRWFGPFLIIISLVSNMFLFPYGDLYYWTFLAQCILILLPFLDFLFKKSGVHIPYLRLITHFYAMNLALLIGFFRSFRRIRMGIWDRTERNQ